MQVAFDNCAQALDFAINNKSFGLFHSTENKPNTNIHTHECCEIFLCLKGGNNFLIDGNIYDAEDGDLFFMNQFETHKITFMPYNPVERYVLQIHPEFIFNFSTENTDLSQCFYSKHPHKCHRIHLGGADLELFKCLFDVLTTEYEYGDDVIKRNVVVQLLVKLNMFAMHVEGEDAFSIVSQPLRLAMDFINNHFQENINLEMISRSSYISVNQLCKLFKLHLGTTVSKYLLGKRISEAKKMLKKGYNVSDTAMMCGFGDYSNFIRTFSRQVGISPGKYTKNSK